MQSPIVRYCMRDTSPHAPDHHQGLVIFNIRAYDFWNHPYFRGEMGSCPARITFESLAFRLRPIAMTDSDDSSLWRVLSHLEEATSDVELCAKFRTRYDAWFSIDENGLRPFWPAGVPWESKPPVESIPANWSYSPTPVQELWDRVFGDGPHSDFRRVLANKVVDWNGSAQIGANWRMARMIATITALRPLVIDVHNSVLDVVAQHR